MCDFAVGASTSSAAAAVAGGGAVAMAGTGQMSWRARAPMMSRVMKRLLLCLESSIRDKETIRGRDRD